MTTGQQPQPAGGSRPPVFVDDSGRRHQRLRVAGWVVAVLAAAYLALFTISLLASPDVLPLSLPGVGRLLPDAGAPRINGTGHHKQRPGEVLSTRSPTPSPTPNVPVGSPTITPSPAPSSARPTGRPSTLPTVAPSTPPGRTRTPVATPRPTKRRGTPTARPTTRGTGKPTARPTHTRSPGGPGVVVGSPS